MKLTASPVTHHQFKDISFYLKRDDLLHPEFSGNKARKFASLLESDLPNVKTIIGYGSCQANSLYSLAALAKLKGWQLEFYVNRIPNWLKANPVGNYAAAINLGATIHDVHELSNNSKISTKEYILETRSLTSDELFIEEGGRDPIAEKGIKGLAEELLTFIETNVIEKPLIALPAGTGTTSLYLQKHLQGIKVVTCSCVGGEEYLKQQFSELDDCEAPQILIPPNKHHFGKLYPDQFQLWDSLKQQTGIEFDLLYDPLMWQCLLIHKEILTDHTLIYIHQGGLLGNETMIRRYTRLKTSD